MKAILSGKFLVKDGHSRGATGFYNNNTNVLIIFKWNKKSYKTSYPDLNIHHTYSLCIDKSFPFQSFMRNGGDGVCVWRVMFNEYLQLQALFMQSMNMEFVPILFS
jgi:hypothetical protein